MASFDPKNTVIVAIDMQLKDLLNQIGKPVPMIRFDTKSIESKDDFYKLFNIALRQGYIAVVAEQSLETRHEDETVETNEIDDLLLAAIAAHGFTDENKLKIAAAIHNMGQEDLVNLLVANEEHRVKIAEKWTKDDTCGVCKHFKRDEGQVVKGVCLKKFSKNKLGISTGRFQQVQQSTHRTLSCAYERDETIHDAKPAEKKRTGPPVM